MVWVGQNPHVFVIFPSSCLPYIKDCQLYSYRKYNYTDKYLLRFHSVPDCGKKLGSMFLIGLLSFAAYIFESSWDKKKILQHRTWTVVETSSSALAEHCMFASG